MHASIQEATRDIAPDALSPSPSRAAPARSRRGTFLRWLRNVHGWIGLWGAVIGLLFGVTGILQNHRAVMRIDTGRPAVSTIQVPVPSPAPKSPRELAAYLQDTLKIAKPAVRVSREPARPVAWGDQSVTQPEHWTVRFMAPGYLVDAEMWKGDAFVGVTRREQGLIGTVEALHRSEGAGIGWILFADSIAGALILLSLTGVLLWTELNRRKTIGASIFIVSLIVAVLFAAQSL